MCVYIYKNADPGPSGVEQRLQSQLNVLVFKAM